MQNLDLCGKKKFWVYKNEFVENFRRRVAFLQLKTFPPAFCFASPESNGGIPDTRGCAQVRCPLLPHRGQENEGYHARPEEQKPSLEGLLPRNGGAWFFFVCLKGTVSCGQVQYTLYKYLVARAGEDAGRNL